MLKRTLSAIWQSHNLAPCPYSTGPAVNNNVSVDVLAHIRALPQSQKSGDKTINTEIQPATKRDVPCAEGAFSEQEFSKMHLISTVPSK